MAVGSRGGRSGFARGGFAAVLASCTGHNPALDAPSLPRKAVLIFGQSNAGSQGIVSQMSADNAPLAQPYANVPYVGQIGQIGPPITNLALPYGPLQPYNGFSNVPQFGIELSMARDLDAAQPNRWAVIKFNMGSTSLRYSWNPTGAWPSSTNNLFTQQISFVKQQIASYGWTIAALVWIQGEEDASVTTVAQQYGTLLPSFITTERAQLGLASDIPFVYGRLNILNPYTDGAAAVRAAQEATQGAHEIMVDQDPYPMLSSHIHYTSDGYVQLGHAYATAILANDVTP